MSNFESVQFKISLMTDLRWSCAFVNFYEGSQLHVLRAAPFRSTASLFRPFSRVEFTSIGLRLMPIYFLSITSVTRRPRLELQPHTPSPLWGEFAIIGLWLMFSFIYKIFFVKFQDNSKNKLFFCKNSKKCWSGGRLGW